VGYYQNSETGCESVYVVLVLRVNLSAPHKATNTTINLNTYTTDLPELVGGPKDLKKTCKIVGMGYMFFLMP